MAPQHPHLVNMADPLPPQLARKGKLRESSWKCRSVLLIARSYSNNYGSRRERAALRWGLALKPSGCLLLLRQRPRTASGSLLRSRKVMGKATVWDGLYRNFLALPFKHTYCQVIRTSWINGFRLVLSRVSDRKGHVWCSGDSITVTPSFLIFSFVQLGP